MTLTPSGRRRRGELSDETLIGQMREGDTDAYAELWQRHYRAGLRAARSFDHLEDPDDLVAEAFTRIFRALQDGTGPTVAFRPYLYTTIRNIALRRVRDLSAVQDFDLDTIVEPGTEEADLDEALDKSLTVNAFRALPERWQTVLWYTEVERMTPVQAGGLLGLTANATSALAFRARSALRAAWLQAHVADDKLDDDCREALKHIGEYTQGTLSRREAQRVKDHLDTCTRCSIIAGEIDHVSGRLAIILLPLVLGGAAALAFGHALAAGAAAGGANVAGGASIPAMPGPGGSSAAASTSTAAAGSSATAFTTVAIIAAAAVVVVGGGVAAVAVINSSASSTHQASRSASAPDPAPGATTSADPVPVATVPAVPDPTVPVIPVTKPTTPPVVPAVAPVLPPVLPVLDAPTVDAVPVLINSTTTTFSGTGTPGAEIEVSGLVPTADIPIATDGSWQWTDDDLVEGTNTIGFVQRQDGYQDSVAVSVTVVVDTVAPAKPLVDQTWSDTQLTPPQFSGTAEPLATVILADQGGDVLVTTTADAGGDWSSGPVPGLDPADTGLTAVQVDQAGNTSPAAIVGPFAFVPVIDSPLDGAILPPMVVPLDITGWPGETILIDLDGQAAGQFTLDSTGALDLFISGGGSNLSPGTYSVTIRYGTTSAPAAASTTATFVIN